jgi:agmatine deiminase
MNHRHSRRSFLRTSALLGGASVIGAGGCSGEELAKAMVSNSADPRLSQYAMPPEDAPHERTFMQWPSNPDIYGQRSLRRVQTDITRIANAISGFEPVVMLASGAEAVRARRLLSKSVDIWDIPTDDLWCRDSGPTFVKNDPGELAVAHIAFNGWGNKQEHGNDGRIASAIAARLKLPLLETGLVGEQGGIEHDGAGTLLAHASCWVNSNRNSGTAAQIGTLLNGALGGEKIIWAPGIKDADITDYHIDALARFVAPGKVLIQIGDKVDRNDPWSVAAFQTLDILKQATDARGRKLDIVTLPEPINIRSRKSDFVSSYVNYYVCNGAVICAEFGDRKADAKAQSILRSLYPGRKIVPLDNDAVGEAGGGIHCATQQQPKAGI